MVFAGDQLIDAGFVDVESNGWKLFPELDSKRQADVAEANDADFKISRELGAWSRGQRDGR
jgi:hypothetical protein